MSDTDLILLDTEAKLYDDLVDQIGKTPDTPVFFHKNRNGTIVIATGQEPDVWPEDEKV